MTISSSLFHGTTTSGVTPDEFSISWVSASSESEVFGKDLTDFELAYIAKKDGNA